MIYDRILDRIPQHLKHDAALALLLLSDATTRWSNHDKTLLQAIKFIQKRHGFNKFLCGNFEAIIMKKWVVIFMPNLIEVNGVQENP